MEESFSRFSDVVFKRGVEQGVETFNTKRQPVPIPEGVEVFEDEGKLIGEGEEARLQKKFGLSYIGKVLADSAAGEIRQEIFDLEFQPGPFYARINFAGQQNADRAKIINTAGLIAKEIVLRWALLDEFMHLNNAVLEDRKSVV